MKRSLGWLVFGFASPCMVGCALEGDTSEPEGVTASEVTGALAIPGKIEAESYKQ